MRKLLNVSFLLKFMRNKIILLYKYDKHRRIINMYFVKIIVYNDNKLLYFYFHVSRFRSRKH